MISPAFVSQILNIFLLSSIILAIGLGVFVWWQNKKSLLHIIFVLLCFSITIWLFGTFMMLRNCATERLVVFWDRFLYLGVIFIPVFLYHFCLEFTQKIKEKKYKNLLFLGYIIIPFFLLLSRTDYFVKGTFYYKWGCHTTAQIGHHLFLVFFVLFVLLTIYFFFDCWRKSQNPILKIQSKYIFFAFLLLFSGSIEYLPAYKISVLPFGYLFPLIWLLVIGYVITRYQWLNIKVIATDILVATIVFTILVFTILSESIIQFIVRGIFLILVIIFGWLTIRGVHREAEEKERLEEKVKKRTRELQGAYDDVKKRKEDLEKFYKLTVGRELKMIELKKKIKELEEKIKSEPR